jgi:Rha family phage regulatory protein
MSSKKPDRLMITERDGKPYVRSTNFAKVFERRHDSVTRSIERSQKGLHQKGVFVESSYQDRWNKSQPEFLISENGFRLLTQSYKTEEQLRHLKRYQLLFNQANKQEFDIIKPSNWWGFGQPKYRMEEAFPGSIPGEVYANALYYFAPLCGKVADIMAGSGMLKRVYDDRKR